LKYTAKASQADNLQTITIEVPITERYNLKAIMDKSAAKHGGCITVDISTPKRPRTTGPHSQNSCVWGWVETIAEVLDMDRDRVYQAMKRMAVDNGYPTVLNELDGCEEPKSQADATVEECSILLKTIEIFAGVNGIALPLGWEGK